MENHFLGEPRWGLLRGTQECRAPEKEEAPAKAEACPYAGSEKTVACLIPGKNFAKDQMYSEYWQKLVEKQAD